MLPGQVGPPARSGERLDRFEAGRIEPLDEGDGIVPRRVAEQVELAGVPGHEHGRRRSQPRHDIEAATGSDAQRGHAAGRLEPLRPAVLALPTDRASNRDRDRRRRQLFGPRSASRAVAITNLASAGPSAWSATRSWWASNEQMTSAAASAAAAPARPLWASSGAKSVSI